MTTPLGAFKPGYWVASPSCLPSSCHTISPWHSHLFLRLCRPAGPSQTPNPPPAFPLGEINYSTLAHCLLPGPGQNSVDATCHLLLPPTPYCGPPPPIRFDLQPLSNFTALLALVNFRERGGTAKITHQLSLQGSS